MITAEVKGKNLIITMPLETPHASSSGRTMIVASSGGPTKTEAQINGKQITVNLQAWFKEN